MVEIREIAWEAYLVIQYKVRHYICSQQNGIFHRRDMLEPLESFTANIGLYQQNRWLWYYIR